MFVENIKHMLQSLEDQLKPDEVAQVEVILNNGAVIYPELFSALHAEMIIVNGIDADHRKVIAMINQSSAQILVTKVKREQAKQRQRIGFELREEGQEAPNQ